MRDTHTVYAMYFNSRTRLSGHRWQGRFYSTPLDENHLWAAVRYVEMNPVRAGMVERAEAHPWSSAAAHCGLRDDPVLSADFPPAGVVEDWRAWLRDGPQDIDTHDTIRKQTRTGRPCGSPKFLDQLEDLLGRLLRPKKSGRPRKDAERKGKA
jgi:putative transposase